MRKNMLIYFLFTLALALSACIGTEQKPQNTGSAKTTQTVSEAGTGPLNQSAAAPGQNVQKTATQEIEVNRTKKIRFIADGHEIIVSLEAHPAADALYAQLPMELSFEDFNGTEKIAYPNETLPTEGSPTHCDPDVGSLCYYIPWGNLCFFYRDFRASESLMPLGKVESGIEFLEILDTAGNVRAEALE